MRVPKWPVMVMGGMTLSLLVALILPLLKGDSPIRFGLDLSGGMIISYRPDFSTRLREFENLTKGDLLERCKEILSARLSRKLNTIPDVVIRSDDRIVVSIPTVENYQEILRLVGKTHYLTMRLVLKEHEKKQEGVPLYKWSSKYFELGEPVFSGEMIDEKLVHIVPGDKSALSEDDRSPKVAIVFREPYGTRFEEFTEKHQGKILAILLDDRVEIAATIISKISNGEGVLSGRYSMQEAADHVMLLKSGTLPVSLHVENLSAVGPTLGQEVKEKGLAAFLLSILLIIGLIFVAYLHQTWFLIGGLVSLIFLLILIAGLSAALSLTLDMVGIAGLVLAIGMGVDGFIIIFESLEPTLRKIPTTAVAQHSRRIVQQIYSFPLEGSVIFHSNATTLVTVILLFFTDRLRSFALFSVVGIIASIMTLFITRTILEHTYGLVPNIGLSPMGWLRDGEPKIFHWKKIYALFVTAIAGFVILLLLGYTPFGYSLEFGSDFWPGTQIVAETPDRTAIEKSVKRLNQEYSRATVRYQELSGGDPSRAMRYLITIGMPFLEGESSAPAKLGQKQIAPLPSFGDTENKAVMSPDGESKGDPGIEKKVIEEPELSRGQTDSIISILTEEQIKVLSIESIDSKLSKRHFVSSLTALIGSIIALVLYFVIAQGPIDKIMSQEVRNIVLPPLARIWVATGTVLGVLVDVAVMLMICAVLRLDISLPIIGGIITIIGYSVNDSVVLWNHVWKSTNSVHLETFETPDEVVTKSVDAILSRAVLTSLSTLLSPLAILLLDISVLKDFAWVTLVGTISGTLSSLFVVGWFSVGALQRSINRSGVVVEAVRTAIPPQGNQPSWKEISEMLRK